MARKSSAAFLISMIHQISGRHFSRLLKEQGITEFNRGQGRILSVLWQEDKITTHDLCTRTGLGKSTLTTMLDRLEKSGQIKRLGDPSDKRITRIALLDKTVRAQRLYNAVSEKMLFTFYKGFSGRDQEQFEEYLERILKNIEHNKNW